jgi:branched-chain amino acid transport system permease protein
MTWVIQTLNGVSFGALLFLLASGFTVTFGLMRVVNLAHGAFYLLGGYVGYFVAAQTGSFGLAVLGGGLAVAAVGALTERYLARPLRANLLAQVLVTIGLAYVIADVSLAIWGGNPLRLRPPEWATGAIDLLGVTYPRFRFLLLVAGIAAAVVLWLVQHRTRVGVIVRAGVEDRQMVSVLGVDVDRLFLLVFTFGAFLAGVSGVIGSAFLTVYPHADWEILALALVVVIIGGLGSLAGAMVGSVVVGLLDAYGRFLIPELSYFVIFAPMAILLAVRPTGLFGRAD